MITDNGPEFISKEFTEYCKKEDIKLIHTTAHTPQANGIVERFNGTLKRIIQKQELLNKPLNQRLVTMLTDNYNQTPHDITKIAPEGVVNPTDPTTSGIVKEVLSKNTKHTAFRDEKDDLKKDDKVRVALTKDIIGESHVSWSQEIYTITQIYRPTKVKTNPMRYKLKGEDGEVLKGMYNRAELMKIDKVEGKDKVHLVWEVDKFVKKLRKNGKTFYVVKWKGHNHQQNTEEPEENLKEDLGKEAFDEFVKTMKRR